jgi:hypothetical protein
VAIIDAVRNGMWRAMKIANWKIDSDPYFHHTSFKYQAGSTQRLQNDWNGV